MKVIPIDSVPEVSKNHPRAGLFMCRDIARGIEGTPNNFSLELVKTYTDFFSPRHKHNFDQFRFQLEGAFDFDRDGNSVPGTVIYHPQGAPYGPQTSNDESLVLVLQFGGASGHGYMSAAEIDRGIEEMKAFGSFDRGVFTRTDETGRNINQDATEAVWEHVNGRNIDYPPPRYQGPVFMNDDSYRWVPVTDEPGVSRRLMGVFTERRTEVGFLSLEPGASHRLDGPKLYFVVSGEGEAGEEAFGNYTTVHVEAGEAGTITASSPSRVYFMGLPNFDRMAASAAA